jgi:hypothetical protein
VIGTKNLGFDKIICSFDVKPGSEILRCAQNDNKQSIKIGGKCDKLVSFCLQTSGFEKWQFEA